MDSFELSVGIGIFIQLPIISVILIQLSQSLLLIAFNSIFYLDQE